MIDPTQSAKDKKAPSFQGYLPAVVLIALVLLLTSLAVTYTSPNSQAETTAPTASPASSLEATEAPLVTQIGTSPDATGIIVGAAFLVLVILVGTLAVTRRRGK